MEARLRQNKFTLTDFLDQLGQLKNMGSMQDIMAMIPGAGNMKDLQVDEKAMAKTEAIIQSMTPYERENPSCIGASRKKRIAKGCGQRVEDVNKLLKQFDMMQKMVRSMSGPGASKKLKKLQKRGGFPMGFPGM